MSIFSVTTSLSLPSAVHLPFLTSHPPAVGMATSRCARSCLSKKGQFNKQLCCKSKDGEGRPGTAAKTAKLVQLLHKYGECQ